MYGVQDFVSGQARIFDARQLVTAIVHYFPVQHKVVLHRKIEKLSSRICVGNRNLDSLDIKFFGERNGVLNRLSSLARQSENKVAVNYEAELVSILGELPSTLDGCALLDVFQDLRIARFIADNQEAATCFLHGFEGFVISGYA